MPKLVQRQGYKEIVPSGWEQFAQLIAALAPALRQMQQQKQEQDKFKQNFNWEFNQALPTEQENFVNTNRQTAEEMGVIQKTPQLKAIKALQGYGSPVPFEKAPFVPRAYTPLEAAKIFEAQESGRRETNLANAAFQDTRIKTASADITEKETNQRLTDWDSTDPIAAYYARFKEYPPEHALKKMSLDPIEYTRALQQGIVGTEANKEVKTQEALSDIVKRYPNPEQHMPYLKQLAAYQAGLTTEWPKPPKGLESVDAQKARIDELNQKNRAAELGIQRERLNYERLTGATELAKFLAENLPDTQKPQAIDAARTYMKTGALPKGMLMPASAKEALDAKYKEVQMHETEWKIAQGRLKSVKFDSLLELSRAAKANGDEELATQYADQAQAELVKIYPDLAKQPVTRWRDVIWNSGKAMLGAGAALTTDAVKGVGGLSGPLDPRVIDTMQRAGGALSSGIGEAAATFKGIGGIPGVTGLGGLTPGAAGSAQELSQMQQQGAQQGQQAFQSVFGAPMLGQEQKTQLATLAQKEGEKLTQIAMQPNLGEPQKEVLRQLVALLRKAEAGDVQAFMQYQQAMQMMQGPANAAQPVR